MVESRKAYIYRTNFAKLFRGSQDGKQENLPAVLLLTFIFTLAFRVYIEFGIILDDVYNLFFIGLSTFFLCNSRNLSVVYVTVYGEKKRVSGRLVLYGDEKDPWIALDYYQVFEEGRGRIDI